MIQQSLQKKHLLIIDKKGVIGLAFLEKLQGDFPIVFVSKQEAQGLGNRVSHVPFRKRIPVIPNALYSHIIVIQNNIGDVEDFLLEVVEKAHRDKSVFVFAAHVGAYEESLLVSVHDTYSRARILLYGDIFTKENGLIPDTSIYNLLYQTKTTGLLRLANTGMRRSYPVFLDDVLHVFTNVIFEETQNSRQLGFLFPKHPPTDLTLARLLSKTNPLLHIDFYEDKKPHRTYFLPTIEGEYLLFDNYPLLKRITDIDTTVFLQKKAGKSDDDFDSSNTLRKKEKVRAALGGALLFLFSFFILSCFSPLLFAGMGALELKQTKEALLEGNVSEALRKTQVASALFNIANATVPMFSFTAGLLQQDAFAQKVSHSISLGKEAAETLTDALMSANALKEMFAGKSIAPRQDLANSITALHKSIRLLEKEKTVGKEFVEPLRTIENLVDVFPTVLGFDEKKTYAVFFQNNMELRPGGGFMGSYALLTVEQGKIMDFVIQDIYDADGQLKGHVEPPFPIRRYLPSTHLYLRDSNFNIDFSKGAATSALLLNQEIEKKIDGVISLDINFVRSLVKALGSVYVSDYNETVTADNLYKLAQTHAEKNSFAGSSQKKDFLRSLFNAIELRLSTQQNLYYAAVFQAVSSSLKEKHVLFAFSDPTVQNAFVVNGFSSSLWDDRSTDENTLVDFFGVNEANLGVNKANYFIKRKIKQQMIITDDGTVTGKATIYYNNTGTSKTWPGGDYKNYLRFVLPLGTKLTGVYIDGKEQKTISAITNPTLYEAKKFVAPKELEIENSTEGNKSIYGFLVVVPTETLKTVSISYTLLQKVSFDELVFNYDLWVFKQPGTDEDPYEFLLTYPVSYNVLKKPKLVTTAENKIYFSSPLKKDQRITLQFVKK